MPMVKVKTKYQVTLPPAVRKEMRLDVGDVLEARVEKGKITLTPQALIDRRIAEGLEDIRKGREHGPYRSVEEAVVAFRKRAKKTLGRSRKARS